MSWLDAIHRALTGERTRWGERGLRRPMKDLERRLGSAQAAAQAVGVNKGTWWRWKTGRSKPRPESVARIRSTRRRLVTDENRVRQQVTLSTASSDVAPGAGGLVVEGWVKVSDDERWRTLKLGRHLGFGRLDRMADAWYQGDDATVEQELQGAVNEYLASGGAPDGTITNPQFDFGFGPYGAGAGDDDD